ncbi:hypothetical protein EV646_10469 [Kribbella antiqua]|uniref:Uncharacterized protein n=1 Tax=Kribbella antiqua TaxID=2512217 RepID=A0A4R2IU98_9ACTN|nr:hypothetical protein [Kribbella antiqua]TCO48252.1 hypothetical protein EV646_10469 [Kribbella antiqua]
MTDDLKDKFELLVADPPPPSAVPSEAVFARVRTVRRRRTAAVVTVAATAVVAIVVAAGNLTDVDSRPPVTGTTPVPVITGPPTVKPTTAAIAAAVALKPVVSGRTVRMSVTVSGTVLVPTADGANLPADTTFLNLSAGTTYNFGDGYTSGSDGGGVMCSKSKKRTTGRETYQLETHTYAKPGTYTFTYSVQYCGAKGWFPTSKTTKLVIR